MGLRFRSRWSSTRGVIVRSGFVCSGTWMTLGNSITATKMQLSVGFTRAMPSTNPDGFRTLLAYCTTLVGRLREQSFPNGRNRFDTGTSILMTRRWPNASARFVQRTRSFGRGSRTPSPTPCSEQQHGSMRIRPCEENGSVLARAVVSNAAIQRFSAGRVFENRVGRSTSSSHLRVLCCRV